MSCRKAGPDSSGILSLSNSCLRPPGQGGGRFQSELAHLAVSFPHPPKRPQMDATLFPCWALQRQNLTEAPKNPVYQRSGWPISQRLRWETLLRVATQGYLTPEGDHAPSKLCHFPGTRGHQKMRLKSLQLLLPGVGGVPLLLGKPRVSSRSPPPPLGSILTARPCQP